MSIRSLAQVGLKATRNMALGANVASLTLARNPRQMLTYVHESLFLYKSMTERRGLPQKNVWQVLPAENVETITLANLKCGDSWFHSVPSYASDLVNLCVLCKLVEPRVVFEIGTYRGSTAFHLALNSPDGSRIYTLDLPSEGTMAPRLRTTVMDTRIISERLQSDRMAYEESAVAQKVTRLFGDSSAFDYSPYYGTVDLFFIDGAHSYEYVRSDTINALQCCHPGSVIAWHDFARVGVNGVSRWLLELSKKYRIYSIPGGSLAFTLLERV